MWVVQSHLFDLCVFVEFPQTNSEKWRFCRCRLSMPRLARSLEPYGSPLMSHFHIRVADLKTLFSCSHPKRKLCLADHIPTKPVCNIFVKQVFAISEWGFFVEIICPWRVETGTTNHNRRDQEQNWPFKRASFTAWHNVNQLDITNAKITKRLEEDNFNFLSFTYRL